MDSMLLMVMLPIAESWTGSNLTELETSRKRIQMWHSHIGSLLTPLGMLTLP